MAANETPSAIQTALDNLQVSVANAVARLAELDALPLDTRARMTYSVGVMSYDWNGYRDSLLRLLQGYEASRKALLTGIGPWQFESIQG